MGEFTGGALWIHDNISLVGHALDTVPKTHHALIANFQTRNTWLIFNGHRYHESLDSKLQKKPVSSNVLGLRSPMRLSIVAFMHKTTFKATLSDWQLLRGFG